MRSILTYYLFCLLIVISMDLRAGDPVSPEEAPLRDEEQFAMLWKRSPFVLSSVEPINDLSGRYAISGVATVGNKPRLFIRDNKEQQNYGLSDIADANGMRLIKLIENRDPLKVKAIVQIAGRETTLTYDAEALKAVAVPAVTPAATATPEVSQDTNPQEGWRNRARSRRSMRNRNIPSSDSQHGSMPVIARDPISPPTEAHE